MSKLVDPITAASLLIEEARAARKTQRRIGRLVENCEVAGAREDDVTYEMTLVPPPGAKLLQLTCASTYRQPIPVQFDPSTRTCYPILKD